MCYCPFAKAHCEAGTVKITFGGPGQPSVTTGLVCEFWNGTDCRIRLVLELMENKLKTGTI